jgi:hypothetical protein
LRQLPGSWPSFFGVLTALMVTDVARAEPLTGINMPDYWPQPPEDTRLIKHISTDFYGKRLEGLRSIYRSTSRDTFTKRDYIIKSASRPTHNDTWYLRRRKGVLVEYRDDLKLATNPNIIRVIYRPGREINWGGRYELPPGRSTTESSIAVDAQRSDAYFSTSPASQYGYTSTKLEAILPTFTAGPYTYEDVAVVYHYQSICLDKACNPDAPVYNAKGAQVGGAQVWQLRYWLAPGKGIIQTQYLQSSNVKGDPTKGRIDFVSLMCEAALSKQSCERN